MSAGRVNIILGFHTYLEDYKEVRRIVEKFGLECIVLSDPSENLNSGLTGDYKLYYGGTPLNGYIQSQIFYGYHSLPEVLYRKDQRVHRERVETAYLCGKTLWHTGNG